MSADQLEINDLLGGTRTPDPETETLAPGAMLFWGYVASAEAGDLTLSCKKFSRYLRSGTW